MAQCVGGRDVPDCVYVCVPGSGDWCLWELCGKSQDRRVDGVSTLLTRTSMISSPQSATTWTYGA